MARRNLFDLLRPIRRLVRPIEVTCVERCGWSPLSVVFRTPVLVLHTTGCRTGEPRATTLACHPAPGGGWFVVGGAGGQSRTPDWVANLRADPTGAVTADGRHVDITAVELTGYERARVWPELCDVWPQIVAYERRARRSVPVFRLDPRR